MFNTRYPLIKTIHTFLTVGALGMIFTLSSCGDDGGGENPDPGIDVEELKASAVINLSDADELNLVGVSSFTTGLGTGYTFDQSSETTTCGVESSYIGAPDVAAVWDNGLTIAGFINFGDPRKFERIIDLGKDVEMNIGDNIGENGGMNITFSRRDVSNDLVLTSWISDDGTVNKSTGRLTATDVIVNNSTEFYVATISPSGEMKIQVNGVEVASKMDGHPVTNIERTSNFIGRSNWCFFDLDFSGSMSGLWVFNKVLSAEEISALQEDGESKL